MNKKPNQHLLFLQLLSLWTGADGKAANRVCQMEFSVCIEIVNYVETAMNEKFDLEKNGKAVISDLIKMFYGLHRQPVVFSFSASRIAPGAIQSFGKQQIFSNETGRVIDFSFIEDFLTAQAIVKADQPDEKGGKWQN